MKRNSPVYNLPLLQCPCIAKGQQYNTNDRLEVGPIVFCNYKGKRQAISPTSSSSRAISRIVYELLSGSLTGHYPRTTERVRPCSLRGGCCVCVSGGGQFRKRPPPLFSLCLFSSCLLLLYLFSLTDYVHRRNSHYFSLYILSGMFYSSFYG